MHVQDTHRHTFRQAFGSVFAVQDHSRWPTWQPLLTPVCPPVPFSSDYHFNLYLMDSAHSLLPPWCSALIKPPLCCNPDVTTEFRQSRRCVRWMSQRADFILFYCVLFWAVRMDCLSGKAFSSQLQMGYYLNMCEIWMFCLHLIKLWGQTALKKKFSGFIDDVDVSECILGAGSGVLLDCFPANWRQISESDTEIYLFTDAVEVTYSLCIHVNILQGAASPLHRCWCVCVCARVRV